MLFISSLSHDDLNMESNVRMTKGNELTRMKKEANVASFEIVIPQMPGRTEQNY